MVVGAEDHNGPEALFAGVAAFPAKAVIRHPPTLVEEEGQLQLPLF
jgi:hypothetical protein